MLVATYDSNVLYPAALRDLLVRLGATNLVQVKWTEEILGEMVSSIVRNRPYLQDKIKRTRVLMKRHLPTAMVSGYEKWIPNIQLPDSDDRHVLASAIHSNSEIIVTNNLKDFPQETLDIYGIEAKNADDFIFLLFGINPNLVIKTIREQASDLKRYPKTFEEVLYDLGVKHIPRSVASINQYIFK